MELKSLEIEGSIKILLEQKGYVDMSTLNKDEDYKLPTYGLNPYRHKDLFSAEKFIRIESWEVKLK